MLDIIKKVFTLVEFIKSSSNRWTVSRVEPRLLGKSPKNIDQKKINKLKHYDVENCAKKVDRK